MKRSKDKSSSAEEITIIEGAISADTCISADGNRVSGIRKIVIEEIAVLHSARIIANDEESSQERVPARSRATPRVDERREPETEETVIKAENDLRVQTGPNGLYISTGRDPVEERHKKLVSQFPEGFRRISIMSGELVPLPSRQEQAERELMILRGHANGLPPLSTLCDDDETPLDRK